jgi:SAM-dependent methyltransferase
MPSDASDDPQPRYAFPYSDEGPYGVASRLIQSHAPDGLILDLGCGHGAIGEHLKGLGRHYVGVDRDEESIRYLSSLGLESYVLDITNALENKSFTTRLREIIGGRILGAVLVLDVLEHLVDPDLLLLALHDLMLSSIEPVPLLVTSIPNVSHIDIAAKLLAGRWDMTTSGLLDSTHLRFFTAHRIAALFSYCGFEEVACERVILKNSDQHFPICHPFLAETPTRAFLEYLRNLTDNEATTNQFVQAWHPKATIHRHQETRSNDPSHQGLGQHQHGAPFLSVIVRTLGNRNEMLEEALTCLAAQSLDSIEVLVVVHTTDLPSNIEAIKTLVENFPPEFSSRVTVTHVTGGGRSLPLNKGVSLAKGNYVAFLDDDDLVLSDWAEAFRAVAQANPGKVIRTKTLSRPIRSPDPNSNEALGRPVTLGQLRQDFANHFDFLDHLATNHTPINSFAIPRILFTDCNLAFDENLNICEDWDLLLSATELVGLAETNTYGAIYQRWEGNGSTSSAAQDDWLAAHALMLAKREQRPLLIPPHCAPRLALLAADPEKRTLLAEENARLKAELNNLRDSHRLLEENLATANEASARSRAAAQNWESQYNEIINSTSWRATAPLRKLSFALRTRFSSLSQHR